MSRYSHGASLDCKVYVGDLPKDATEKEIERAFDEFGPVKSVWVARNPSGFAFVEFDDARDAEDAVKSLDGAYICGVRARVEFSTGKSKSKPWQQQQQRRGPPQSSSRKGFDPDDRCYECGERGHYAYDCEIRLRGRGRRRSGSGSRSRGRRRSRSRSRDRSRSRNRSPVRKYSRSRSASPRRRSRSRERNSVSRGSPGSDK